MSDVKLQDWPEGVRLRITYWHDEEEPGRCAITSYAGKWRFFEPVSVEIEPHPEGFYVLARDYDRQAAEIARLRTALATARQDALAEIKQDTDELIEQGRQDGMEYAAQIAEGRPSDRGEDIVAAIRAAAKEVKP